MRSSRTRQIVPFHVILVFCAAAATLPAGCSLIESDGQPGSGQNAGDDPPDPVREFRGVFVTTAFNLDWPSRPGLHPNQLDAEIHEVVSRVKELNCNVVILQVRALGDRIHRKAGTPPPSPNPPPWAASLNHGDDRDPDKQNRVYDPLARWIAACHEEGLELHAWVNPFRLDGLVEDGSNKMADDDNKKYLPVIISPDENTLFLDASYQNVQTYALGIIKELLYYPDPVPPDTMAGSPTSVTAASPGEKIDGLLYDHVMPPPPPGSTQPVLYSTAVKKPNPHQKRLGWLKKKSKSPANNPNPKPMGDFIEATFHQVYEVHGLKFGLSPCRKDQQADKWLAQGKVNYMVPELYFQKSTPDEFKNELAKWLINLPLKADFKPIVVSGLAACYVVVPHEKTGQLWPPEVIIDQISDTALAQGNNPQAVASGHAFYSWSALRSARHGGPPGPASNPDENLGELLQKGPYHEAALVPICRKDPGTPQTTLQTPDVWLTKTSDGKKATWEPNPDTADVFLWAVRFHDTNPASLGWGPLRVFGGSTRSCDVPSTIDEVAVKAVDRYNRESPAFGRPKP